MQKLCIKIRAIGIVVAYCFMFPKVTFGDDQLLFRVTWTGAEAYVAVIAGDDVKSRELPQIACISLHGVQAKEAQYSLSNVIASLPVASFSVCFDDAYYYMLRTSVTQIGLAHHLARFKLSDLPAISEGRLADAEEVTLNPDGFGVIDIPQWSMHPYLSYSSLLEAPETYDLSVDSEHLVMIVSGGGVLRMLKTERAAITKEIEEVEWDLVSKWSFDREDSFTYFRSGDKHYLSYSDGKVFRLDSDMVVDVTDSFDEPSFSSSVIYVDTGGDLLDVLPPEAIRTEIEARLEDFQVRQDLGD